MAVSAGTARMEAAIKAGAVPTEETVVRARAQPNPSTRARELGRDSVVPIDISHCTNACDQ
jgi:hypothetical protein